jgi:hypothetical protein
VTYDQAEAVVAAIDAFVHERLDEARCLERREFSAGLKAGERAEKLRKKLITLLSDPPKR